MFKKYKWFICGGVVLSSIALFFLLNKNEVKEDVTLNGVNSTQVKPEEKKEDLVDIKEFDILTKNEEFTKIAFMSDRLKEKISKRIDEYNKSLSIENNSPLEEDIYVSNAMLWVIKKGEYTYLVDIMGYVVGVNKESKSLMIKDITTKESFSIKPTFLSYFYNGDYLQEFTVEFINKGNIDKSVKEVGDNFLQLGFGSNVSHETSIKITTQNGIVKEFELYKNPSVNYYLLLEQDNKEVVGVFFKKEQEEQLDKLKLKFIEYGNYYIMNTTEGVLWALSIASH